MEFRPQSTSSSFLIQWYILSVKRGRLGAVFEAHIGPIDRDPVLSEEFFEIPVASLDHHLDLSILPSIDGAGTHKG
jgi:hypothetical protein